MVDTPVDHGVPGLSHRRGRTGVAAPVAGGPLPALAVAPSRPFADAVAFRVPPWPHRGGHRRCTLRPSPPTPARPQTRWGTVTSLPSSTSLAGMAAVGDAAVSRAPPVRDLCKLAPDCRRTPSVPARPRPRWGVATSRPSSAGLAEMVVAGGQPLP